MAINMAKFSIVKRVNPNFYHEIWLWNVNLTYDYDPGKIPGCHGHGQRLMPPQNPKKLVDDRSFDLIGSWDWAFAGSKEIAEMGG